METVGERLRRARMARKFSRAHAGEKLGIAGSTVASHENGQTQEPKIGLIRQYAKLYKKRVGWLVTGHGSEEADDVVPLMGYIGAGGSIDPEFEQVPEDGLDLIDLPAGMSAEDAIAFAVKGASMKPKYEDGDLLICTRESRDPEALIGIVVAVRTADNKRYLKRLQHGRRRGLYRLESFNDDDINDVRVVWVGDILFTIPAHRRVKMVTRQRAVG